MIKAAIFDMDGLLIDSDPYWKRAEIEVFKDVGLDLTWEMAKSTSGMREDEAINHWYHKYPWNNISKEEVLLRIESKVIEEVREKGQPLPGVIHTLEQLKDSKIPIGLASSSLDVVIEPILSKLGIKDYFKVVYSAQHEEYGKPHPGVYITTAKKMNVNPEDCLAFEDSYRGLIAAKAAKMKCVVVPEKSSRNDKRFGIADLVLVSLEDFKINMIVKFG